MMSETLQVFLSVLLAVVVSTIGGSLYGVEGAVLGFIIPLLIIGLFHIFKKSYEN
jgi:phosphotransferase system  glucose/maltose/N-acetylglucosamine-specific IIC component